MSSQNKPAIIYLISCRDATKNISYIGSTCNYKCRIATHRSDYRNSQRPLYKAMRANGGLDNFTVKVLSVIPNWTNAKQYREVEKSFIKTLKPTMNKNIPNRTCREYQKQHPEKVRQYCKTYRDKYPEKYKSSVKRWQEKNKEKIAIRSKQHYRKNKTIIDARANQKIGCICGCINNYSHIRFGVHRHSKKHNTLANQNLQLAKSKLKSHPDNINPLL